MKAAHSMALIVRNAVMQKELLNLLAARKGYFSNLAITVTCGLIFFWSEEHAKEYRHQKGGEHGAYLTLPQCAHFVRISQSALFGFPRR